VKPILGFHTSLGRGDPCTQCSDKKARRGTLFRGALIVELQSN